MKPTTMIYNEVHRQIIALKIDAKTACDHAENAVDDYQKNKGGVNRDL